MRGHFKAEGLATAGTADTENRNEGLQEQSLSSALCLRCLCGCSETDSWSGSGMSGTGGDVRRNAKLGRDFYARGDAPAVARELLGKLLVVPAPTGERVSGRIVEVEAYCGVGDRAS